MEQIGEETQEGQMATQDTDEPIGKDLGILMEQSGEETQEEQMATQDTYEPTVKDLCFLHIEYLNSILHGNTQEDYIHCGPSKMQLWKRIAEELIKDYRLINYIEKLDRTPCEVWLDHICMQARHTITISRIIEISEQLRRNDIKYMFEELYFLGARYTYEIRECERDHLVKLLEYKDSLSSPWKDYAVELGFTMDQIEDYSTFRFPVITNVLNYLRNCKPNTTLSSMQKICRDEEHNIGANVIENIKTEISAARETQLK